ncbi:MAG TPA: F0F1 ATP synthase subunit gamma [Deltaproteobacteria bacterium]|nr:F0F1 ATP synthase subunit gamma [Deltaproteobacteria bacterium]HOM28201.1 F0F1 ATP synthase subunit gamma [Deltaproteobacteria bacterium]HPP81004.1 F0F1 ATP synthase subunit gamma [Deltaproteobacteria bacterium]
MQTLESLKRRIKSTQDLLSVVKTMKALAAVSIRQYQRAVESLADYARNVEMGLQVVLQSRPREEMLTGTVPCTRAGAVVFGSDQGLCGQFNALVTSHALDELDRLGLKPQDRYILTVGERVKDLVTASGQDIYDNLSTPSSIAGITPMVQEMVLILEEWHFGAQIQHIYLYYNHYVSGATYHPATLRLLPVDQEWLEQVRSRKWESKSLPMFTQDWQGLFLSLLREYLFVSLYRAFTESLASENASRLASMQNAEKNIQEHLEEIHVAYHRQRQMTITEELLDIVAGYEAMKGDTRLGKDEEKQGRGMPGSRAAT